MMKRGHDVESAPSIWRRRTAMEHYAGIGVSLELSSVCVVDAQGKIVKEAKVASEPEAVVAFFEALGFAVKRIGLEAGPLSQWLHAGLKEAGFETVLLETRHVKAALSAMTVKTDRKDARGLAQLLRMGWFQQVHAKSMASREARRRRSWPPRYASHRHRLPQAPKAAGPEDCLWFSWPNCGAAMHQNPSVRVSEPTWRTSLVRHLESDSPPPGKRPRVTILGIRY